MSGVQQVTSVLSSPGETSHNEEKDLHSLTLLCIPSCLLLLLFFLFFLSFFSSFLHYFLIPLPHHLIYYISTYTNPYQSSLSFPPSHTHSDSRPRFLSLHTPSIHSSWSCEPPHPPSLLTAFLLRPRSTIITSILITRVQNFE